MIVVQETIGEAIVLMPKPGVDSSTAKQFEEIILDGVEHGPPTLVIDCAGLDSISSAGLRAILIGAKAAKAKGHSLILCGMRRHIRLVFDTSGFSQLLPITRDREEALNRVTTTSIPRAQ